MGKWAVIYSSVTGNTKKIAEAIAEAAGEADVFAIKEAPEDLSGYEVVALGYWIRRGGPDDLMKAYLPKVKNSRVFFFETHGTEKNNEHAITAFARSAYLLGEGCEVLSTFGCQGRVNPVLIERRRKAGADDPHGGKKALERLEKTLTHPDEVDIAAAKEMTAYTLHKLELKKKYANK